MARILAFGDSHTYGEGLSDCINYKFGAIEFRADRASQYAWPAILGRKLDKEVINFGRPGCSNRFIANAILNSDIKQDDLVIVLWTVGHNRTTIFNSHGPEDISLVHPTKKDKISRVYYKYIHQYYNSFLESMEYINLANAMCSAPMFNFKAIDVRVKTTWPDTLPDMEFDFPKWNKVNLIEQSLYHIDFATDDHHPGPESQKLIASDILERIKLAY